MSKDIPTGSEAGEPDEGSGGTSERREFGPYWLLKELGRGAQGVVFLAEDKSLRRKVALKMLTGAGAQSQNVRDRFRREAELTSRFEHPGICGVHDLGEVDGMPYIAMQYVRGTTLAALIEKAQAGSSLPGPAPGPGSTTITIAGGGSKGGMEDVLRLVERAARALHVAHEAGLVHRDIKPANIMVTPEGHPVLLDFGLARDLDSEGQNLTQSGQIMGTPAYLAPEQIVASRGKVDRRTDVYALGVTLFECVTLQRPFEGTSWDQLFHEILEGAPRNPRKLNPRIPEDLRIVIEEAMDRDPERRYATAEAFAEDLRRVRSFEPILAKDDGPLLRLRKWSLRNPGRAASAAAGLLFVLSLAGFVGWRMVQRAHELRAHLAEANAALVAADYVRAAVEVAKAQELDPESAEVRDLLGRVERGQADAQRASDRRAALAGAAAARDEAQALGADYETARRRIEDLSALILKERSDVLSRYADDTTRAALARREDELSKLSLEVELKRLARSEALERARRLEEPWGGISAATESALADYYLGLWREASTDRDDVRAEAMRTAVERHDPRGLHRAELLGRGTLALSVVPSTAQAWLFRYEDYQTVRSSAVIPRLVPVPTAGIGRAREGASQEDFHPGDPCLVVLAVEPGSVAARNGLEPGDLVLSCNGVPAANAVCVRSIARESSAAAAGIAPLARVLDVDGFVIANSFDWVMRMSRKEGKPPRVRFAGSEQAVEPRPSDISVASVLDLVNEGASVPLRFDCLKKGVELNLDVGAGARAGLRCEVTAYPLVLADSNRIDPATELEVDPGSYLILVRNPGYEDQRFPVLVTRAQAVSARIELHLEGTSPPGFVYIPPGAFVAGGDPAALRPQGERRIEEPGFFLARAELTNREWYEFVNDPRTLEKISEIKPGEHLYLPQDDKLLSRQESDGSWTWAVYDATSAESPVLGISWSDVRDWLAWRNARAAERGEPWRYDLPSESQWEKAARGVDARLFPWGNRFDPSLTVCLARQDGFLLDAPGGYEPRDESPYGVRELGGSREEWLRDRAGESEPPRYWKRGGHWGTAVEVRFHSAGRAEASQDLFASFHGVRLVARKP